MNDVEQVRALAERAVAKESDWLLREAWTEGMVAVFRKSDDKGRAYILDCLENGPFPPLADARSAAQRRCNSPPQRARFFVRNI